MKCDNVKLNNQRNFCIRIALPNHCSHLSQTTLYYKPLYTAKYIVVIMTEKIERSGSEREVYRAIQSDGPNWFFTGISRAIMVVYLVKFLKKYPLPVKGVYHDSTN